MDLCCPQCKKLMTLVGRTWVCGEHEPPVSVPDPVLHAIDRLPSVLALPLSEFAIETHPVMRLHRLCDALEIVTRLLTMLTLGEVRQKTGDKPLPEDLLRELQPRVERPTFGQWKGMLEALRRHCSRTSPLVVPEVLDLADFLLERMPGGEKSAPEECIITLRNRLVHGGGTTKTEATRFLKIWESWMEKELIPRLAPLGEVDLCHLSQGSARRLVGPERDAGPERLMSAALKLAVRNLDGHVVLLRDDRWLDLWPLCDYGRATQSSLMGTRVASACSPLVYLRVQADRLLYAALGVELPIGEQLDPLSSFRQLFQLQAAREARPTDHLPDFEVEIQADASDFVGRKDELAQLKAAIKATPSGVLWVTGPGGIGKSFLVAKLACDLGNAAHIWRIAWRFKASDMARCSRVAFLRHAVERLAKKLGRGDVVPAQQPTALEDQLGKLLTATAEHVLPKSGQPPRVLFVLDGLDEIARCDPSFPRLPFQLAGPHTLWLCAGRPEEPLPSYFSPDRCTHVFAGGVPFMSSDGIRGMLLDRTGSLKYDLLKRDQEQEVPGKPGPVMVNAAVDAIVKKACTEAKPDETTTRPEESEQRVGGLPLYVRFVVEDIVAGHFQFQDIESRLPASLERYYDDLLKRLSLSDPHMLLTPIVVTLAWAREPLDLEALVALIAPRHDAPVEILRQTIQTSLGMLEVMLRPAPTPDGRLGYEIYHPTFRSHVQAHASDLFPIATANARADTRRLILDWEQLPADHPARGYVLRHSRPFLCSWDDLDGISKIVHTRFVRENAVCLGSWHALDDGMELIRTLARGGEMYWAALIRCARDCSSLSEEVHRETCSLEAFVKAGRVSLVQAHVQSELNQERRGLLLLGLSVLAKEYEQKTLASGWRERAVELLTAQLSKVDLAPTSRTFYGRLGRESRGKKEGETPARQLLAYSLLESTELPIPDRWDQEDELNVIPRSIAAVPERCSSPRNHVGPRQEPRLFDIACLILSDERIAGFAVSGWTIVIGLTLLALRQLGFVGDPKIVTPQLLCVYIFVFIMPFFVPFMFRIILLRRLPRYHHILQLLIFTISNFNEIPLTLKKIARLQSLLNDITTAESLGEHEIPAIAVKALADHMRGCTDNTVFAFSLSEAARMGSTVRFALVDVFRETGAKNQWMILQCLAEYIRDGKYLAWESRERLMNSLIPVFIEGLAVSHHSEALNPAQLYWCLCMVKDPTKSEFASVARALRTVPHLCLARTLLILLEQSNSTSRDFTENRFRRSFSAIADALLEERRNWKGFREYIHGRPALCRSEPLFHLLLLSPGWPFVWLHTSDIYTLPYVVSLYLWRCMYWLYLSLNFLPSIVVYRVLVGGNADSTSDEGEIRAIHEKAVALELDTRKFPSDLFDAISTEPFNKMVKDLFSYRSYATDSVLAYQLLQVHNLDEEPELLDRYGGRRVAVLVRRLVSQSLLSTASPICVALMCDRRFVEVAARWAGRTSRGVRSLPNSDHIDQIRRNLPLETRRLRILVPTSLGAASVLLWLCTIAVLSPIHMSKLGIEGALAILGSVCVMTLPPQLIGDIQSRRILKRLFGPYLLMGIVPLVVLITIMSRTIFLCSLLMVPFVVGCLVPDAITFWRGADLLYPTKFQLSRRRVVTICVFVFVSCLLGVGFSYVPFIMPIVVLLVAAGWYRIVGL